MTPFPAAILTLAQAYLDADKAMRDARALRERLRHQLLQVLGPAAVLELPDCTITRHHGTLSVACRLPERATPCTR